MVSGNGKVTWREASSSHPCPRCGKCSWCRIDERGDWCCCKRNSEGAHGEKTDRNGETYYLHRLTPWPERGPRAPTPRFSPAVGGGRRADADTLNQVYSALLGRLLLEPAHHEALRRRGVDPDEFRRHGYRTLGRGRIDAVTGLIEAGLEKHFPQVPGFKVRRKGGVPYWSVGGWGGLVFPVRDPQGRVVKLMVRKDEGDAGCKYACLSSKSAGGPGPGSPTHFPHFRGDKSVCRVTEGVVKADVATRLSGLYTIGLSSVSAWRRAVRALKAVGAKTARVAFDADCRRNRNVANSLRNLVDTLLKKGFAVELETWQVEDGKGIDDLLAAGKQPEVIIDSDAVRAEVGRIVVEAEAEDPPPPTSRTASACATRPTIVISTDEYLINDLAINALSREPNLYARGGHLVHVLRDRSPTAVIKRADGAPRIALVAEATLREDLTRVLEWRKINRQGDEVAAHPPSWCYQAIHARGQWPGIRPLVGVVESPVLRGDGGILDVPGYDAVTGLLYEPQTEFPPVPPTPSKEDAKRAADVLLDLTSDFPFVTEAHRAVWLAGLLTVFARPAIPGPCPMFLFEASIAGSGKTLLCEITGIVATGREPSVSELSDDNEETRKAITAILLEGERLVLLDNAHAFLGCAALDAVLTATSLKGRILGKSQRTADLPADTVWFASGNNCTLRGDTHRRTIPCRLEPNSERPEERSGFKIPDLKAHVREHRPALVVAALTVLRGYFVAGRPRETLSAFGSYEAWSSVVRQAVYWATGLDPCAAREVITAESRGDGTLAGVLAGWAELTKGRDGGLTARSALDELNKAGALALPRLREALANWAKEGPLPDARTLGNRLRANRGRVAGKWQLLGKEDPHTKATSWFVKPVADSAVSADSVSDPFARETGPSNEVRNGERPESDTAESAESARDVFDDAGVAPDLSGPWDDDVRREGVEVDGGCTRV